jgi:hypothetical protein
MPVFEGVAAALAPKERVWSLSYSRLCMDLCKDLSYRRAACLVNAALRRPAEDSMKVRTLADFIDRMGSGIQGYLKAASETVLESCHFEPGGGVPQTAPDAAARPAPAAEQKQWEEEVSKKAEEINAQREPREQIQDGGKPQRMESPQDKCCYISIDDIGVKHQKDTRKDGGSKSAKNVETTVIHIQSGAGSYYMAASGMDSAFRMLVAFMLSNNLTQDYLVFFADGARNIKSYIEKYFSCRPYILILDWYHLKKKCRELISSSLNGGKEQKKDYAQSLLRMLWVGNVKEAVAYLNGLDGPQIKNRHWLGELIGYLERKEAQIVCYALRHGLGLRVSSNRVEKANDLLVAQRQKHSGMSWSFHGSSSLASIAMVMLNNDMDQWLRYRSLSFSMSAKAAA